MIIVSVVAALAVGFLAGLLAFKVRTRWCPSCGATTITLDERRRQIEHTAR
ncbi:hypothetical protein KIF24_05440 [Micromonospora sp. Llam7]|uniref:hypothetical protein n=1 Tax=Micromonospora tarapacensis TaxID=2835305 RepID=UPI001C82F16F|nr:hypothetical protein [Micromonospora tarapacensis]MBX7265541.1 hypothetical protein [Micromonospora tarapacensis]